MTTINKLRGGQIDYTRPKPKPGKGWPEGIKVECRNGNHQPRCRSTHCTCPCHKEF